MAVDPITAAMNIGGQLIDRIWPDPAQRDRARLELLRLQESGALAQISVNTAEANHRSIFVAGWRPFIGWVCGVSCAWNWLGLGVANFVIAMYQPETPPLVPLDLSSMMPVLMGMLGLGALRTVEKLQGKA